jgi:site-specific DNA-cytosine methylase
VRPAAAVLENVTGLLTHGGGSTAEHLRATVEAEGYLAFWRTTDASALLPQVRNGHRVQR